MEHNDEPTGLSFRERCQVIGVATGIVLILGFLSWLGIIQAAPAMILDKIQEFLRAGNIRLAVAGCMLLVLCVVGFPVGLILSVFSIFQGASGRRTRLTRWILREVSQREMQKRRERTLDPLGAEGELSRTDRIVFSYLPPSVGWAVFLAILVGAIGLLLWAATSE
jgi:hypothetical protein